ncbi:hypothetical protein BYT27DRAFT_7254489 [Phlegmacium glaucopus]|nr:hypothetical protein BYT27DRAFT_7254489 [Phlegmacium glaucopus]
MPTLLHQTFPSGPFNDDDDHSRSVLSTSIARTADEIDKARQRTIERKTDEFRFGKPYWGIGVGIIALELERKKVHEKNIHCQSVLDADGYGEMLGVAKKEIDDALDLVHEIRKLMIKN